MAPAATRACPACNGRMVLKNDRTGNPVVCPLCNGTGKYENYIRLPRWYPINAVLTAAAPGNVLGGSLAIDAIADFELIWLTATSTGGIFTSEFADSSGRRWQNLPVNNLNQFGTASLPFPIGLSPVILKAQSQLLWTFTNTSGNANTLQIALSGYDLYPGE